MPKDHVVIIISRHTVCTWNGSGGAAFGALAHPNYINKWTLGVLKWDILTYCYVINEMTYSGKEQHMSVLHQCYWFSSALSDLHLPFRNIFSSLGLRFLGFFSPCHLSKWPGRAVRLWLLASECSCHKSQEGIWWSNKLKSVELRIEE